MALCLSDRDLTWLLLCWLLHLLLLLQLVLHGARMQSDRHGGLHNIGAARDRDRGQHQPQCVRYNSNLAGSSSVGLVRLFLDSFLGRLFLLDTSAAGADTELDFFLGVAPTAPTAPTAEPVPPGHYNGLVQSCLQSGHTECLHQSYHHHYHYILHKPPPAQTKSST